MRKQNSEFNTAFTSEADNDLRNTDYFGFVELDDFACYVVADGIDDQMDAVGAKLAVSAVASAFSESPGVGRRVMRRCLNAANKALLTEKSKLKLKASVMIVLTDYASFRYGQAGNVRLCLYRDGFLKCQSTDQSLTIDLLREERIGQDKVAAHEERNNLYTYLGQEKEFHPFISKKIKLINTDVIALFTRGIWENVDNGELGDVFAEAFSEPQELVDDVEELLLSRQPENLGKYTFATVFVNKVFIDPNKKRRIKRIIMTAVPIVIAAVILTVVLILLHNKRVERRRQMELGYTDTIEYIQIDNYVRAKERCEEAMELAEKLKDRNMQKKLGDYQKLIEAVLLAEEKLSDNQFTDAQKQYKEAANRSRYVDSLGLDYIYERLKLTADYISVYDLLSLGDTLALNLQYDKAEEKYLEAKATAGAVYFDEGRTEAMEALKKLYEDQKAQKKEAKRRAAEIAKQEEALGEDGGNGLVTFAATVLIVILWVAVVCVVVKMDVGGFGSSVLAPILKDVPVVNKILPSTAPVVETDNPEVYGGYTSLEEAVEYIRQLELELEREQTASKAKDTELEALKAEVLRLQEFEERQVEFQRIKTEFYEDVANIDPEGLIKYYESMDPTTMESILKQIAVQEQKNQEVEDYIKTFTAMKPKSAAKMFEAMDDRLDLIAEILEGMSVEDRAAIMDVIDTELGAKLVKMMHPDS